MRIFLSHSTASEDGPVASRIKAIAAAYDMKVILPARDGKQPPKSTLENSIKPADAVVAVITDGALQNSWVKHELEVAKALDKPVLAILDSELSDDDQKFLGELGVPVVELDRTDPIAHKIDIEKALESVSKSTSKNKEVLVVILALVALIVGLLVLGTVMAQPQPEKHAV